MSPTLISICIPTFNRKVYLEKCLASLQEAWTKDIEIVISDNASSDGTDQLIQRYSKFLPIRYRKNHENLGFDVNCSQVIEMARGQYCWILGSDDYVCLNSLNSLVNFLRKKSVDILHFGYVQADSNLIPIQQLTPHKFQEPIYLKSDDMPSYMGDLPNVSFLFAFISSFIFRRECWQNYKSTQTNWIGSHYVHMFVLHEMVAGGAEVASLNECYVIARGGSPNEFSSAVGKFLRLDAITLERILIEVYKSKSDYQLAVGKVFKRSYPIKSIFSIAANGGIDEILLCRSALVMLGYPNWIIGLIESLARSGALIFLANAIKLRRFILRKLRG